MKKIEDCTIKEVKEICKKTDMCFDCVFSNGFGSCLFQSDGLYPPLKWEIENENSVL